MSLFYAAVGVLLVILVGGIIDSWKELLIPAALGASLAVVVQMAKSARGSGAKNVRPEIRATRQGPKRRRRPVVLQSSVLDRSDSIGAVGRASMISVGLVIDEPWISKILSGEKVWEMRSKRTKKRERIALIRKGTGLVVGAAMIVDCHGPLSNEELIQTFGKHRVPQANIGTWRFAWHLAEVIRLTTPISYDHRSGAVTWVRLDENVAAEVSQQLDALQIPNGPTRAC